MVINEVFLLKSKESSLLKTLVIMVMSLINLGSKFSVLADYF